MKAGIAVLLAAVTVVMLACGGSDSTPPAAVNPPPAPYQYKGKVQADLSIKSATTGVTYPYHVYFPPGYDSSGKSYPVIYGTDAQWIFPYFSQTIDRKNKDVIFVGIEEGPRGSDRRAIDFLPNGAPNYIEFLKKEFIPLIEKSYRTTSERSFVGTSYGGLIGSILLSKEPVGVPYFKNYMLYDGSFGTMSAANMQDEVLRFNASKTLNITLVLTSANPGNLALVNTYQARYESRQYDGLTIHRRSYNVPHNDVADPSFNEGIDLIY